MLLNNKKLNFIICSYLNMTSIDRQYIKTAIEKSKPIIVDLSKLVDKPKFLILMEENPEIFRLPPDNQLLEFTITYDYPKLFMYLFNKMQLYMRHGIYFDILNRLTHQNNKRFKHKIHFIYQSNIIKLIIERGNISFNIKAPVLYNICEYQSLEVFKFYVSKCAIFNPINVIKQTRDIDIVKYIVSEYNIEFKYFGWEDSKEFLKYDNYTRIENRKSILLDKVSYLISMGFRFNVVCFLIKCVDIDVIKLIFSEPNAAGYKMTSDVYDSVYKSQSLEIFKRIIKLNFFILISFCLSAMCESDIRAYNKFMNEFGKDYNEIFVKSTEKNIFSDECVYYASSEYKGTDLRADLLEEYPVTTGDDDTNSRNSKIIECILAYTAIIKSERY